MKVYPQKKIRVKVTTHDGGEGQFETKTQVDVFDPYAPGKDGRGAWVPVDMTPKAMQLRTDRALRNFANQERMYKGGYSETPKEHRTRKFIEHAKAGSKHLTNPGGAIGVFIAKYRGASMEGMVRDMKTGSSIWNLIDVTNSTVGKSSIEAPGPSDGSRSTSDYQWKE